MSKTTAPTVTAPTSTAPKGTKRRRRALGRAIAIAAAAVLTALMWANTTVLSTDESAAASGEKFSAQEYAAKNFEATIKPHVQEEAVEAVKLHGEIAADVDAAGKAHGGRDGDSAWAFPVKLRGVAGKVDPIMGQLPVTVKGLPADTKIVIQMGPAINGSALRDVTGDVHFGMFKNQLEFQSVAVQLNRQVKETVLTGIDASRLKGKTIDVVGAFAYGNPAVWIVTPVEIKAAP